LVILVAIIGVRADMDLGGVGLQESHGIDSEVAHVISHHEGQVAHVVFIVEDYDVISHLRASPFIVNHISQLVLGAHKHGNRDVTLQILERNNGGSILTIHNLVVLGAIVVFVEVVSESELTKVVQALERSSRGEVAHVNIESIRVVERDVFIADKLHTQLTDGREDSTDHLEQGGVEPAGREELIDSKSLAEIFDECVIAGENGQ